MAALISSPLPESSTPARSGPSGEGESDYNLDVLFVGTGQSSGLPLLKHVLNGGCDICKDALKPGSKNRRNNVSVALIKRPRGQAVGSVPQCVLVDCGKTFRDSVMNLFPKHGLREVTGLVLTHGHADAILGLDDVRDVQTFVVSTCHQGSLDEQACWLYGVACAQHCDPGVRYTSGPIDVFLHDATMRCLNGRFDYLTSPPPYLDKEKEVLERPVSYLRFNVVDVNADIEVGGVPIHCFPVFHGGEYISLGFDIGRDGSFVYISDVKVIPEETMRYLKSMRIKTLVLDCLRLTPGNWAHASLEEALAWVDELHPERTFFVGMGCNMGDHDAANEEIRRRGYRNVELAYDGLLLTDIAMK